MAKSNQIDFESQCIFSLQIYLYRICIRSWTMYIDRIKSSERERYSPLNLSKPDRDCHWAPTVLMNINTARLRYLFLYLIVQTKLKTLLYCLDIMIQTPSWGSRAQAIHLFFIWCKHSFLILLKQFKWNSHLFFSCMKNETLSQKRALSAIPSHSICSWLARNK